MVLGFEDNVLVTLTVDIYDLVMRRNIIYSIWQDSGAVKFSCKHMSRLISQYASLYR
jgi:hypothetical protein